MFHRKSASVANTVTPWLGSWCNKYEFPSHVLDHSSTIYTSCTLWGSGVLSSVEQQESKTGISGGGTRLLTAPTRNSRTTSKTHLTGIVGLVEICIFILLTRSWRWMVSVSGWWWVDANTCYNNIGVCVVNIENIFSSKELYNQAGCTFSIYIVL